MVHLKSLSMGIFFQKKLRAKLLSGFLLLGSINFLLIGWVSCAFSQEPSKYSVGQLFETQTQKNITLEALKAKVLEADVIYMGEAHYTPSHIEAAIQVLTMLVDAGRQPVLAMEMFGWDGQPALDRYLKGQIPTEEQFLQEAKWEKNWGGEFKDYRPLVDFSKEHRIPLYALNPPKHLVHLVRSKGLLEALQDPSMREWGIPEHISLDDPDYRRVIFPQITACHPGYPDEVYQPFYEASIFRDEGMAKIIKEYLETKPPEGGPLLSYTGGGHIQYRIPVPNRVQKSQSLGGKDLSIYLIAFDPSESKRVKESMNENIADYIWLTKLGPGGPQPRCGG